MVKTVLTYGTFDMFHIGHLRLLKRLSEMGGRLIVGVSTDEFNAMKGKKTLIPFEQRVEIIESVRYVDTVIPETDWEQKVRDVQKYNVDIFAIGNDWDGKFDFLKAHCEVIYLDRTDGISSTQLKNSLKSLLRVPKEEILRAFEVLKQPQRDF